MSTTTTNYELVKPELTDVADITVMNTNWDKIDDALHSLETSGLQTVAIESTNGETYTASIDGITELTVGLAIIAIPNKSSASTSCTLNLNGLGAKTMRQVTSYYSGTTVPPAATAWLSANKPSLFIYDGTYWVQQVGRANAADLYGTLAIDKGGTGAKTAEQARINLGVQTVDGTTTSQNADYAEVGEWADGNTDDEDRIGYFVAIDESSAGTTMVKANSNSDVRGVTVTAPAFSGNCSDDKFNASGALLKQYDYVAVMGLVSVIDNGTCTINGKCMPTSDGTAVPSSNNMGYQVVDRIDDTHILIALEPGADMLNRIKTDVSALQTEVQPIERGGTGSTTAEGVRSVLSLKEKTFCSIHDAELGLSSTPTMDEINNALPAGSKLFSSMPSTYVVGTGNKNIPNAYGSIFIEKASDVGRCHFLFFSKAGGLWVGALNSDATFNKWIELADASKFLPLSDGAGFHNSVYRGKSLGSAVTDEQWAAIKDGTFRDLYIGDYWTIGGINYRIAAFDYYLCSGDNADLTTHHVTLVPDTNMYSAQMNSTDTTAGAYIGSEMYTTNLAQAKTTINNAFGSAHILTHRRYLQNAVTNGYSTGCAWYDSTVELMTEQNVYGGRIFGNCVNGTGWPNLYTTDKSQYPLFAMRPDMISNRQTYWLRDVASASYFCYVISYGNATADGAGRSHGVRPAFSIKS